MNTVRVGFYGADPERCLPVLVSPERVTGVDDRSPGKIVGWRRGRNGPFKGSAVPWIVTGWRALSNRANQVPEEEENPDRENECADRTDQIHWLPTRTLEVGMSASGHPDHSEEVHREKGYIEPDHNGSRDPIAEFSVPHFSDHLRQPEINPCEEGEDTPPDEDVVEVCHHEIGVLLLGIGRGSGVHDAGKTTHHKHPDESE